MLDPSTPWWGRSPGSRRLTLFGAAGGAVLLAVALLASMLTSNWPPAVAEGSGDERSRPAAADPREKTGRPAADPGRDLEAYRGMGTWVDIYDEAVWKHPARSVRTMAAHGVRTLYIETTNYKRDRLIMYPEELARIIELAHAAGIKVVAWYLPGFADLDRDMHRTRVAVQFRTPNGHEFDSFALDIESPEVEDPATRSQRLLELSARIRQRVGDDYTLGAIIPSPKGMRVNPEYWPGFPYRELRAYYDLFIPMTYFTWRTSGLRGGHNYTARNITIIRTETGDRTVPIHVIGGIAQEASTEEAHGFVRAVREAGIVGASWYTLPGTTAGHWEALEQIPANPVQAPGLPVPVSFHRPLGNIPGRDESHPKEVFYKAGPASRDHLLTFRLYGVQAGEVELWVNWRRLRPLWPTGVNAWSEDRVVVIPATTLRADETNYISFVADGKHPRWRRWGVQLVSFEPVER